MMTELHELLLSWSSRLQLLVERELVVPFDLKVKVFVPYASVLFQTHLFCLYSPLASVF
jgi:hypothetical protein